MKQHFDKHAHRLSESERELIWRQIGNTNQQERRRRVQFITAISGASAVVAAGLILAVMLSDKDPERRLEELSTPQLPEMGAPRTDGGDAMQGRVAGSQGDENASATLPTEASKGEAAPGGGNEGKAAGPAVPVDESTVATPEAGRRDAAAGASRTDQQVISKLPSPPPGAAPLTRTSQPEGPPLYAHESVLVEGEAPLVDVKSSESGKSGNEPDLNAFAVDNPSEAMALEAGVRVKKSDLYVRGGRSGKVSMMIDGVPISDPRGTLIAGREVDDAARAPRRGRCWIPPDYRNPNGEPFDAMYFRDYGTNPFIVTEEDALSTFAVDVDNASYTLVRRYLDEGQLPPPEAVRVEEFVNFFDPGYGRVRQGDLALHADGAPAPYGQGYHLLRLGLQARAIDDEERRPANLVFVIDTSGSMDRENRLELVKRALGMLLDELNADDTVGIVEYGSEGRIVLPPTSLEDRRTIERAIERLHPNGSTNAEEGLDLGYTMASRIYDAKAINRLILCSDGVANTGETEAERILDKVRYQSDRGIHLSTIGFGMGNYNDVLMETLADKGDGNYYYVDRIEEAARVFRENLTGTLQTLGRDAKIQVEFDSEQVSRWRLIGYENRDVADRDFRNDAVDAGEIGAGHRVVALYEIKLSEEAERTVDGRADRNQPLGLGTLRFRYEKPEQDRRAGEVVELERRITTADLSVEISRADSRLRLAGLAAEFAEILRGSYWARDARLADLVRPAARLAEELRGDEAARELARLIERAARLADDGRGDWREDRKDEPARPSKPPRRGRN